MAFLISVTRVSRRGTVTCIRNSSSRLSLKILFFYLSGYVDISLVEEEANLFVEKISDIRQHLPIPSGCCLLE